MKQFLSVLLFLTLFFSPIHSGALDRTVFDAQMAYLNSEEYRHVEQFLEENKGTLDKDPEYYVLLLNYVFSKGTKEEIVVDTPPGEGNYEVTLSQDEGAAGDIEIRDPETGKVVGSIGSQHYYNERLILSGIEATRKAIDHFADRLDIHFGIVTIAERINRLDIVADQLVRILVVSKQIDNQWKWGPINTMDGDPKKFMIDNILNRTRKMFYAETKDGDDSLIVVSEALIEHYPDLNYGYANLGTVYMAQQKLEQARTYYEKALKIAPNDEIVIQNLRRLDEQLMEKERTKQ